MAIYIARVYADLIEKQKKTLEEIPEDLREEVKRILYSRKEG